MEERKKIKLKPLDLACGNLYIVATFFIKSIPK
jgi:hypothetical protein